MTLGKVSYAIDDMLTAELQKLSRADCLTPKDKADVLVHAHKICVGELWC